MYVQEVLSYVLFIGNKFHDKTILTCTYVVLYYPYRLVQLDFRFYILHTNSQILPGQVVSVQSYSNRANCFSANIQENFQERIEGTSGLTKRTDTTMFKQKKGQKHNDLRHTIQKTND